MFKSCGGTNGGTYDNILNHSLDILFCVNGKTGDLYSIPIKDIRQSDNRRSISLRIDKNKNGQGFNTYQYLVYL